MELQLQNSVTLAASRYVGLYQALQRGDTNEIRDNLDWWLDQSILELGMLEERYPKAHWDAVQVPHADRPEFTMRVLYGSISRFRRDHPRHHTTPLDAKTLKRIDDFVRKYQ